MYMKGRKSLYYKYRVMVTNQAVNILKRYLIVIAHNPGKTLTALTLSDRQRLRKMREKQLRERTESKRWSLWHHVQAWRSHILNYRFISVSSAKSQDCQKGRAKKTPKVWIVPSTNKPWYTGLAKWTIRYLKSRIENKVWFFIFFFMSKLRNPKLVGRSINCGVCCNTLDLQWA